MIAMALDGCGRCCGGRRALLVIYGVMSLLAKWIWVLWVPRREATCWNELSVDLLI